MSTAAPSGPASANLKSRLRDAFWLESALREVSARSADQQSALRSHYLAAVRRADVADQLTDEQSAVASLLLYREAATFFAVATALAKDAAFDPKGALAATPFALLRGLAERNLIEKLPPEVTEAETILGVTDPLAFDTLSVEDILRKRATVSAAIRFLRAQIEPRTVQEIKVSRFTRTVLSTVAIVVCLGTFVWRVTRPTNIALHKPTTMNGRHPDSTAPLDNSGATNGEIESTYGIHTSIGQGWVMVDLLKVHKISGVKIYNRADGYFNDGLPMTLELSQDGTNFTLGEVRTTPFTSSSPWEYDGHGKPARYVRVKSANYVALTEIEVFGSQ